MESQGYLVFQDELAKKEMLEDLASPAKKVILEAKEISEDAALIVDLDLR